MDLNFINTIIKIIIISLTTFLISVKIINYNYLTKIQKVLFLFMGIIISIFYAVIRKYLEVEFILIITYFIYSMIFKIVTKNKIGYSMLVTIIAIAIAYPAFGVSGFIEFFPRELFGLEDHFINLIIIGIIDGFLLFCFFKIKRFRSGFIFLKNKTKDDYIDIFVLNISVILIFMCMAMITPNDIVVRHVFIGLIMTSIIMIIGIKKTLTMYYKQKLLDRTIKEYEQEIKEKDEKFEKVSKENLNFVKINHEFYNRQKALELKVNELISNSNFSTELSEEMNVLDRINTLSEEYSSSIQKVGYRPKLPSTGILGIDDMFKYMQSECEKNDIKFDLQIKGNINYLINNIIDQDRLETLIGDHIRDAIIAIKSCNSSNRRIIAILGIVNNCYEFCVHDTGIEFYIDTLLKLGIEPTTTHKEEGGTGIGFITTFETLKKCKASLIIEEKVPSEVNYTKSVRIRFDGKNEYRICSYRAEEISKLNKDSRIKVEKANKKMQG